MQAAIDDRTAQTPALAVVVRNVQRLQEALRRQVSIENPSCYLGFAQSTLSEPAFLAEVASRSGCGLLLDINNIAVTAHNLRLDARDWLDLPTEAITQYHLAGHAVNDADGEPILIDDHGSPVSDGVWALFADVVQRFGRRPTLIEWDTDLPPLAVLLDEAARADRLEAAVPLALRDLQAAFAAHLLGGDSADLAEVLAAEVLGDAIPAAARLRVYRHHVFESLGSALAATFPTVQALVGTDFFRGLARAFVGQSPPDQPVLPELARASRTSSPAMTLPATCHTWPTSPASIGR